MDRKNVKLDRLAQMTVRALGGLFCMFVLVRVYTCLSLYRLVFRVVLDPARPPPPNEPTHRARANTQPHHTNQEGYSGSDLKEMCRAAVMAPVRELVPYREDGSLTSLDLEALDVGRCRKVKMRDFEAAMKRVCTYVSSCIDSMPHALARARASHAHARDTTRYPNHTYTGAPHGRLGAGLPDAGKLPRGAHGAGEPRLHQRGHDAVHPEHDAGRAARRQRARGGCRGEWRAERGPRPGRVVIGRAGVVLSSCVYKGGGRGRARPDLSRMPAINQPIVDSGGRSDLPKCGGGSSRLVGMAMDRSWMAASQLGRPKPLNLRVCMHLKLASNSRRISSRTQTGGGFGDWERRCGLSCVYQ